MDRKKELLLISHCIINQNSVVLPLARSRGAFPIVKYLIDDGIGFIQLPCPEFQFLGLSRSSMTKDQYDTPNYRQLCRNLFMPFIKDIKNYINEGYTILGILGIRHSPSCGITGRQGIFIEEALKLLKENNLDLKTYDIPENYTETCNCTELYKEIISYYKEI